LQNKLDGGCAKVLIIFRYYDRDNWWSSRGNMWNLVLR